MSEIIIDVPTPPEDTYMVCLAQDYDNILALPAESGTLKTYEVIEQTNEKTGEVTHRAEIHDTGEPYDNPAYPAVTNNPNLVLYAYAEDEAEKEAIALAPIMTPNSEISVYLVRDMDDAMFNEYYDVLKNDVRLDDYPNVELISRHPFAGVPRVTRAEQNQRAENSRVLAEQGVDLVPEPAVEILVEDELFTFDELGR